MRYYSPKQAAALTGLSIYKIRYRLRYGKIKFVRLGPLLQRIPESELARLNADLPFSEPPDTTR